MTEITITEDVAETMRLANLGPRWADSAWSDADDAWATADPGSPEEATAQADRDAIEAAQEAGEADYAERWAENARRIATQRGYDLHIAAPGSWRETRTACDDGYGPESDTVERVIWQAAHDATDLPEGW